MTYQLFLVEDHPVMREAYARVLASEPGLDLCGEAETAEEALDVLATQPCDLVVTDIRLPGMSGIDLVEQLHRRDPGLPVVVISGHEDAAFERRARKMGAVAFLPKRLAATQLLSTIWGVLRPTGAAS